MTMVKKSITITEQQEVWIQSRMSTGNYASDSEVMRELIRQQQAQDVKIDEIRTKLIKAEESGMSDLTPEDVFNNVIERKRKNGQL